MSNKPGNTRSRRLQPAEVSSAEFSSVESGHAGVIVPNGTFYDVVPNPLAGVERRFVTRNPTRTNHAPHRACPGGGRVLGAMNLRSNETSSAGAAIRQRAPSGYEPFTTPTSGVGYRCLVVIDLKLGKFTHADAGQMHLYLNYAQEHWTHEGENPPVVVIFCTQKDTAVVHYALENLPNKVLAAEYRTTLPAEKTLAAELEAKRRLLESRAKKGGR
jgi:hypothetical protein